MPEKTSLQGSYTFRGVEYVVTMQVKPDSLLTVTVEDRLTANQWKGSFDSAYIEDMTHKTGNYKQFHVFVNMLESAITQTSDSVTMDLLTFSDLELLRKRKAGVGTQSIPGANNSSLTQKRYMILTYAVEFDKIHYPLPLPYAGKPDPEILQETIRRLQTEIKHLKSQDSKDYRIMELDKLKYDYDQLLSEKEAVEQEYILYRKELKHTSAGVSTKQKNQNSYMKEIRILKGAIKNLEEELMKEKAKHQRLSAKRRKENQELLEEVQELRTLERTLKVRLKSLTNELAVYKRKAITAEHGSRSRTSRPNTSTGVHSYRERSLSRDRGRSLSAERPRSAIERRSNSKYENASSRLTSPLNRGPLPYDRRSSPYERRSARPVSRERTRSGFARTPSPGQGQALRPSPAGTRKPRFDPTAYITEKNRQRQTARTRSSPGLYNSSNSRNNNSSGAGRTRGVRSSPNLNDGRGSANSHDRGRTRHRGSGDSRVRTSSVESLGSVGSVRRSRNNSYCSDGNVSDSSQRGQRSNRPSGHKRNVGWGSDSPSENRYTRKSTPSTSTPNVERFRSRENIPSDSASDYLNRSADIDDIDARLQRIQEMMKAGI